MRKSRIWGFALILIILTIEMVSVPASANPGLMTTPYGLIVALVFYLSILNIPLNIFFYFLCLFLVCGLQKARCYVTPTRRFVATGMEVAFLATIIGSIVDIVVLLVIEENLGLCFLVSSLMLFIVGYSFYLLARHLQRLTKYWSIVVMVIIIFINGISWFIQAILLSITVGTGYEYMISVIVVYSYVTAIALLTVLAFALWYRPSHEYLMNQTDYQPQPEDIIPKEECLWVGLVCIGLLVIIAGFEVWYWFYQ